MHSSMWNGSAFELDLYYKECESIMIRLHGKTLYQKFDSLAFFEISKRAVLRLHVKYNVRKRKV